MGTVTTGATMSLDGFIADASHGSFDYLFKWYGAGDVEVPAGHPDTTFKVSAASAEHLRRLNERLGALVAGRRRYDMTSAWGGHHPLDLTTVVVTHQRPSARPEDDENFVFVTTGIADAVARAREIASDKDVGINGGEIARQCFDAGLTAGVPVRRRRHAREVAAVRPPTGVRLDPPFSVATRYPRSAAWSSVREQTGEDPEIVQFGADRRLAVEGCCVALVQRIPAQALGQRQRADGHRTQRRDRLGLGRLPQRPCVPPGRLGGGRRLQVPEQHRQLSCQVLLGHRHRRPVDRCRLMLRMWRMPARAMTAVPLPISDRLPAPGVHQIYCRAGPAAMPRASWAQGRADSTSDSRSSASSWFCPASISVRIQRAARISSATSPPASA